VRLIRLLVLLLVLIAGLTVPAGTASADEGAASTGPAVSPPHTPDDPGFGT
jgi:hypothetical protein